MNKSWNGTRFSLFIAIVGSALQVLSAAELPKGKEIFEKKCAMCHAKDLKGNPAMIKVLKVDAAKLNLISKETLAKTDAELIAITTKGKEKMPAQAGKLKPEEIANIIAYVRSSAPAPEKP